MSIFSMFFAKLETLLAFAFVCESILRAINRAGPDIRERVGIK